MATGTRPHRPGRQGAAFDASLASRSLAWLYAAAATIGAISMVLPHPSGAHEFALWSNIALGYATAVALFAIGPSLRPWAFHIALVAGSVLITRAVLSSGDPVSLYAVWFIWVGLYAFYFFSRVAAAAHVGLVAVLYGATLILDPPASGVARWLTTVATLVVAGVLIDRLVGRAELATRTAEATAETMAEVAGVAHELGRLADSHKARVELCRVGADITEADAVALWEPSADGATLVLSASAGARPTERALPFVAAPGGAGKAFATGEVVTADDGPDATRQAPEFRGAPEQPASCVWQPVLHAEAPRGVLAFYFAPRPRRKELLTLTRLLATEADVTLSRVELLERLEATARTDDLTGLPNRRAWDEHLRRELARARRDGRPICVAMLDLDGFKAYNDERGHQMGDQLLKRSTAAWVQHLRESDVLARYGGDEFAVLLAACSLEDASEAIDRLRTATPGDQTCSAGVVRWDGSEGPSEVVARADAALYEAKRGGRDRAVTIG